MHIALCCPIGLFNVQMKDPVLCVLCQCLSMGTFCPEMSLYYWQACHVINAWLPVIQLLKGCRTCLYYYRHRSWTQFLCASFVCVASCLQEHVMFVLPSLKESGSTSLGPGGPQCRGTCWDIYLTHIVMMGQPHPFPVSDSDCKMTWKIHPASQLPPTIGGWKRCAGHTLTNACSYRCLESAKHQRYL